jgi:hypothetical protein
MTGLYPYKTIVNYETNEQYKISSDNLSENHLLDGYGILYLRSGEESGATLRGLFKLNEYTGNVLYDSRNNLSNGIKSGASWVSDGVLVQLPASNYSLDVNTGVFTLIGPYLYHYLTVIYETLSDKSAYNSIGVIENSGMTLVNYLPLVFLAIVFGAILFVVLKVIIPYLNLDKENKW